MKITRGLSPCPYCGGEGIIRYSKMGDYYIDAVHTKKMQDAT